MSLNQENLIIGTDGSVINASPENQKDFMEECKKEFDRQIIRSLLEDEDVSTQKIN